MADMNMCNYCHRVDSNLRRCSRCYSVYYCSKRCQTLDWLGHKTSCSKTSFDIKGNMESDYSNFEKNIIILPRGKTDNTLEADSASFEGHDKVKKNGIDKDKKKKTSPNIQSFSGVHTTQGDKVTESHDKTDSATGPSRGGAEPSSGTSRDAESSSWTRRRSEPFLGNSSIKSDGSYRGANNMRKSATESCAFCSRQRCFQKCSRCKEAFYCSKECQKSDWSSHKDTCIKKLTKEEENIKKLHEKKTEDNEKHRRFLENIGRLKSDNNYEFAPTIKNFQGPVERMSEMLTLKQALYLAKRPGASLPKAVRIARVLFPLRKIVTDFGDIPSESIFFSSIAPPRDGYVLVAFMYRYHEHVMRHGVYLKDANDEESKVEFYFDHLGDNPSPFFSYSQVKPSGYICLVEPVMHRFGDGSVGIRINNPEKVKVLDIEMVMK